MRASYLGVIAALSIVCPTVLSACGSDDGSERQVQGSVSVALTGVSGSGITYRLRTGNFAITGPQAVNFGTETDLAATTRSFELPAGSYLIRLKTGWTMERLNGMTWETVEAIVLSANPAGFTIIDQQHTGVVFLFRAGDDVIQLGNGVVDVSIAVDDGMTSCPMGQVMCAGVCVDPTSDPNNCGMCGSVCQPGTACQNGNCVGMGCPMGLVQCAGVCVDPTSDPSNCGACGNVCDASATCSAGTCVLTGGDPDGTYSLIGAPISYSCCGGLVNVNVSSFTFQASGAVVLSSPSNPVSLTGFPTTVPGGSFSNSGSIPGGCTETYALQGAFTGPDSWNAVYSINFVGADCSCFGGMLGTPCTSQGFMIQAQR